MKIVFADTGYWIAILNPGDELHQKAREITNSLKILVISNKKLLLTI